MNSKYGLVTGIILFIFILTYSQFQLQSGVPDVQVYQPKQVPQELNEVLLDFPQTQQEYANWTDRDIIKDCNQFNGKTITSNVSALYSDTQAQVPHKMVLVLKAVYNNIDIINDFLYWYLHQGFRRYLVLDNKSTDGTQAALIKFRADYHQILDLVLVIQNGYIFNPRTADPTAQLLGVNLWRDSGWVFVVDADEFIVSKHGLGFDFARIPPQFNTIQCDVEQYCPAQGYTQSNGSAFYDQIPYLASVSPKTKAVHRTNPYLQPLGGHHGYHPRINARCETLKHISQQDMSETQIKEYYQHPCPSYFRSAWRFGLRECALVNVALVNLPLHSLFTRSNTGNINQRFFPLQRTQPFTGFKFSCDMNAFITLSDLVFKEYKRTGEGRDNKCSLPKAKIICKRMLSLFRPPGLELERYIEPWGVEELGNQTCAAASRLVQHSSKDLSIVIYSKDNSYDIYQSLKWHFTIGFRRFVVVHQKHCAWQLTRVAMFVEDVGRFVQVSNIQLGIRMTFSYNRVMEIASQFTTGLHRKYQTSWQTFFITSDQMIVPQQQSLYASLLDTARTHARNPACHVHRTLIVDCKKKQKKVECVRSGVGGTHQALFYNEFNYFQLNFGVVQGGGREYLRLSANATELEQRLREGNMSAPVVTQCSDYDVSIREYPVRSLEQVVDKHVQGLSAKYVKIRDKLAMYGDEVGQNIQSMFEYSLYAVDNATYDPLFLGEARRTAQRLVNATEQVGW